MKKTRKLLALVMAFVMVMAMASTAMAADTTISVKEGDTRSYKVYQIFIGDLSGSTLSNVKWGENGKGNKGEPVPQATLDALTGVNSKSDNEQLEEIKKYVDLTGEEFGTVSADKNLTAPTGYYLFVDQGTVADGESYSLYVVEVVGPTEISPKVGKVTSDKKVDDEKDSIADDPSTEAIEGEDGTDWQDSADYDIGDEVPFKLTGSIPEDYANYKTYYYAFHDEESTGLEFNSESVVVKVDGVTINTGYTIVTDTSDECTFEIVFENLKAVTAVKAGSTITVEYTSTLTDDAVIGSKGNPNTMHLEYSNNPNWEGSGKPDTGNTPDDTVIVFTYKVIVNKVTKNPAYDAEKDPQDTGIDADDNKEYIPLENAGFTLYKWELVPASAEGDEAKYDWVPVTDELTGEHMTTFTWSGLDDGDYKLVETKTPAGYNTIDPIEFTITAEHETESDDPKLTKLEGGNLVTGEFKATGVITTDVVNNAGATLPETGGIGTTIFYAVGGVLVLAAIVLLVSKKRMATEE